MIWVGAVILLQAALHATYATHHNTHPEYPKLVFTSCGLPGWSCVNDTDGLSSSISFVTYQCTVPTFQQQYKSVSKKVLNGYFMGA